ncbi:MAG: response regulator transcription factor [Acidobacteriota bacterium]|nr:response regulator transcription factor [Acidobacteriota bacterium]MDQ7087916.1 response regulator transcription factor [Acidobacteriota bacterium]
MSAKILIVEDDRVTLRLVERLLQAQGYQAVGAPTAEDAIEHLEQSEFDLLILDVGLPGTDGITFCRELRAKWFLPVIMLTARSGAREKVEGLEVGADDYLTKPFESGELLARVRAQLRRARNYSMRSTRPDRIELGEVVLDFTQRDALVNGERAGLTQREFEVMAYLARHPGRPLPREQVFENVWGFAEEFNTNSLDVIIHRIRKKIEKDASRPRHLVTVRGFGYKLDAGGPGVSAG